jgi:hypothetical protein
MASEDKIITLSLSKLKDGAPLTPAFLESLAHAASVCLDDQSHSAPVTMEVRGDVSVNASLQWDSPSDEVLRTWNDDEEATEHGAYGIAFLLIIKATEFQVIERSKKGKGFDYWLGPKGETGPLFQRKGRLEVSGIRNGDVSGRVKEKVAQVTKHSSGLPAIIVVVEFGKPQSRVIRKWNE